MRKLNRNDKAFIICFLGVAFVGAARFFDHTLLFHSAPMGVMQTYSFSQFAVSLYFMALLLFSVWTLKHTSDKNAKTVYYLIALWSVVALPMYLYTNYFGAMDVFAWILLIIAAFFLLEKKFEWMTIQTSFVTVCICPMALFYSVCPMVGLLGYRAFSNPICKKKYTRYAFLTFAVGVCGIIVAKWMQYFTTDAQMTISWHKFVIILLMLSPYAVLAFRFWEKMLAGKSFEKQIAYLSLAFAGVPAAAVTLYVQDYVRHFFTLFFYYIFVVLFLLADQNKDTEFQVQNIKGFLQKWLPMPEMVIIYPMIFFTFWVYGPLELLEETLLGQ